MSAVAVVEYTHRNGEAVPPAEQGYYWYEWEILIDGTAKSSITHALYKVWPSEDDPSQFYCQNWPHARIPSPKVELMNGRWWGPVMLTTPWDGDK